MKRPWVFNAHLPLISDAGLKIVFFCTLSRHKHHFVHNFQDLTTVLLYIIFKILPSPQSFCTNISKFCHKHMYTVQCALCMSYLAQDGTMKKKEHQNIYFNQTQGSIFHFNMMSLVPTSIWNFITWNIYWEKKSYHFGSVSKIHPNLGTPAALYIDNKVNIHKVTTLYICTYKGWILRI